MSLGLCINWLTTLKLSVRQVNQFSCNSLIPFSIYWCMIFSFIKLLIWLNWSLCWSVYFLAFQYLVLLRDYHSLFLVNSIPRKYLSLPRSLILNSFASYFFSLLASSKSFLVMIMSSTYTIKCCNLSCVWVLNK